MNTFTMRRAAAAAIIGLAFAPLTSTSASADELDSDAVAAQLCSPDATFYDAETADYADRAELVLYVYEVSPFIDGDEDTLPIPAQLCTFAIVTTDDDAALDGQYTLSVTPSATQQLASGTVAGSQFATQALTASTDLGQVVSFSVTGRQTAVDVDRPSTAERKSALKKYSAAKKKYKKQYKKAHKTAKAKRTLTKQLKAAKNRYKAATATRTTVTNRPYSLHVDLPIDR